MCDFPAPASYSGNHALNPRSPANTRFESALHRISCQIVCAFRESSGEQSPGFQEAKFTDLMKIGAVHGLGLPLIFNRKLAYALLM
jgi:hypothetical protein